MGGRLLSCLCCDFAGMEIAGGVRRPHVAAALHGAHAEAAAADILEAAVGATPLEQSIAVAQFGEWLEIGFGPDLADGALPHVAEGEGLPELIGVHVALL